MSKFNSTILNIFLEHHIRVIPRDLFNESMLLKSVGRLAILIHDNKIDQELVLEHDGEPFDIIIDEQGLTISNIELSYKSQILQFFTPYNSRDNYPLYIVDENYEEAQVFDNEGNITEEFINFLQNIDS